MGRVGGRWGEGGGGWGRRKQTPPYDGRGPPSDFWDTGRSGEPGPFGHPSFIEVVR